MMIYEGDDSEYNDELLEFLYTDVSNITHSSGGLISKPTMTFEYRDNHSITFSIKKGVDSIEDISEYINNKRSNEPVSKVEILLDRANELHSEADDLIEQGEYRTAIEVLNDSLELYSNLLNRSDKKEWTDTQLVEEYIDETESKKEEILQRKDREQTVKKKLN